MKNETRSFYETAVRRAVGTIVDRLDDALDLGALARGAALSPLHFHRVFRGMVGETPLELHRRLRLERAAHTLAHGDAPVTRVAFEAGYETHESFTRAFGERYAASPSAFRASAREAKRACTRPPPIELASRAGLHFRPGVRPDASITLALGESAMPVDLRTMPELRLATVSHVGPYNRISEAFARLGEIVGRAGLIGPSSEMLALYHDDPEGTPAEALRSDAAVTVPEGVPLPKGITEMRIPAGRYACTVHMGPYSGLGDAWARLLGGWLPQSGERLADRPSFEIYRNTPATAADSDLKTELYAPLV
jgi:AraC family transcriptional regulator